MNTDPHATGSPYNMKATHSRYTRWSLCLSLSVAIVLLENSPARADDGKQIANVVQRGSFAYVYDAKGSQFLTLSAGDGIVGFTQSTVSIRRGNFIYVYNNKGSQTSVIPAGN